jgi:hypothetical protein
MPKYRVKIGYQIEFEVTAKDKKEAVEYAWFEFDESQPQPEIDIQEIGGER